MAALTSLKSLVEWSMCHPLSERKYTHEIRFFLSGNTYQVRYKEAPSHLGMVTQFFYSSRVGVIDPAKSMQEGNKKYIVFSKKDLNKLPYQNMSLEEKRELVLELISSSSRPRSHSVSEIGPQFEQTLSRSVKTHVISSNPAAARLFEIAPSWKTALDRMEIPRPIKSQIQRFAVNIFTKISAGCSVEELVNMESIQVPSKDGTVYKMYFALYDSEPSIKILGSCVGEGDTNRVMDWWYIPLLKPQKVVLYAGQLPLAFVNPNACPSDITEAQEQQANLMFVWDFLKDNQIPNAAKPLRLDSTDGMNCFLYHKYKSSCRYLIHPPIEGLRYQGKELIERLSIADDMLRCIVALHAACWIHSDLKPDNLYIEGQYPLAIVELTEANIPLWKAGAPRAVVGDWATAVPFGHSLIGSTQGYTPPVTEWQSYRRTSASASWDIWAVAVTLDELVTGKRREISELDRNNEIDALIYDLYVNRIPLSEAQIRLDTIARGHYVCPIYTTSSPDPFAPDTRRSIQPDLTFHHLSMIQNFLQQNNIPYADAGRTAKSPLATPTVDQTCRSLTDPLIGATQYQGKALKDRLFVMWQILYLIAKIHDLNLLHYSVTADTILLNGRMPTGQDELVRQAIPEWQAGLPRILLQGWATATFAGNPMINSVPEYTPPEGVIQPDQPTYKGWDLYQCGRLFLELVVGNRGSVGPGQSIFEHYPPLDESDQIHKLILGLLDSDPDKRISAKLACVTLEKVIKSLD